MGENALIASIIGSSLFSGLVGSGGQDLEGFSGDLDPQQLAGQVKGGLGDALNLAIADASKPATVDTTVAPLPSFTGGGLPFDISAPALDPARLNPERRTLEAPDISGFFGALTAGRPPSVPSPTPNPQPGDDENDEGDPADDAEGGFVPGPSEQPDSAFTFDSSDLSLDPLGQGGFGQPQAEDLDQAEGAIELILSQLLPKTGIQ